MKKLLLFLTVVISIALINGCAKDEENLSGTISGIVTEYASSNTPIVGATVTLGGKGLSKTTGSDGRFEFTGVEPGTYTIAVKANNYQANTKQVTVYAGQKVSCDIQLEVEKVNIDISPLNLVFDKTVDMLSFTITNQSNRDLSYNLVTYISELQVSPMFGSIKAKGQQAFGVIVTNRSSIKKTVSGQIFVNVGSDSYQVNVTVNGTEEEVTKGNVMGTISDYANANTPIAGATVTLASTGESKTTGSDGRYEFTNLTPGTHTITVSANEYEGSQKDVIIEAGKNVTCDFQLQKGAANVEVTPQNLTFASDVEQLSFTIKNGTSNTQQYTVSNIPEFVTVSSSTGMISSKGSEAITVTILNRKQIKEKKNAQIKVTVGNNAFVVNISVEPYQEESVSIDILPSSLNFDKTTSQLTFSITNKNNRSLDYTITSDLSILNVSPTQGTIKEKGESTITVSIPDRQKIDVDRVGKLTIDIEGNTFAVPVTVAKYEMNISVSPDNLSFDSNTDKLSFSISNGENSAVDYSISNNLDILTISPENGTLSARGKAEISVSVKNRKNVTTDRNGSITISIGSNIYVVNVKVMKYEDGGSQPVDTEVKNGLFAYFTFENTTKDVTEQELNGIGIATSYVDSYNGTKALNIPAKSSAMFSVPYPLVDQKQMSISFWAKDLSDGHVFHAVRKSDNHSSFILAVENGMLKFVATGYNVQYKYDTCPSFTHGSLTGWHMITLTSDYDKTERYKTTTRLYIDGVYTDVVTETPSSEGTGNYHNNYDACSKFIMGGEINETYTPNLSATKLVVDNMRFYRSRMLSEDEVKTIFNTEKQR